MNEPIINQLQANLYKWLTRKTLNSFVRRVGELPLSIGSDIGVVRSENQDRIAVLRLPLERGQSDTVVVLCDGMGGMAEGAQCAAQAIASFFVSCIRNKIVPPAQRVAIAAQDANQSVNSLHQGRGGATLSAVLFDGVGGMVGVNVGDSRIYAYQDNMLEQLSIDDTMLGLLPQVNDGYKHRSELLQYIGMGDGLEPHVVDIPASYDLIFLTSDGLHFIDEQVMMKVIQSAKDSAIAIRRLIDIAKWCGGHDNASVIAAKPFSSQLSLLDELGAIQIWDPFGELQIIAPITAERGLLEKHSSLMEGPASQKATNEPLRTKKQPKKRKPQKKKATDKAVSGLGDTEPLPGSPQLNIYFNGEKGKDDHHG